MADEEEPDPAAAGDGAWPLHRPLPIALTDRELMSVLRVKAAKFYQLKKDGHLARFAIPKPISRAQWSGEKVQAWLRGEHAFSTSFFGAGRRRRQDFK